MTWRGPAALGLLLALGAGGGYGASMALGGQPTASGVPTPVVAQSPSYPVDPPPVLVEDPDFPALQPGIALTQGSVGTGDFELLFPVPKGWDRTRSLSTEMKWYPPDNPGYTYGLRVRQVDTFNETIAGILADRINALESAEDHFEIVTRTSDSLHFTYVTDDHLRHGLLRWMDVSGSGNAEVEISINGRAVDVPGMEDLFSRVARGMRRR